MCTSKHLISLGFTPDRFPAGTHICYIYNDDKRREEIISKFVESGLQNGEQVAYFTDTLPPEKIREHLSDMGVQLPSQTEQERLNIGTALETYCPDGTFIPERMLQTIRNMYTNSIEEGYTGARGTGEMSWALRDVPGAEHLIEYEAKINIVVREHPTTVVCQYDTRRFDGDTLFDVLNVHPMMIVGGQVVHNPYYTPPEDFLKKHLAKR
ncbi:MAG TPA: MEDS domain-containing protein [Mariprofundaceae bacterium]|nr:MEDS domain-containing protein [Mariprofundaceae bacterium]